MLQALGTIWLQFLQKKILKKFHACVPLKEHMLLKILVYNKLICRYTFYLQKARFRVWVDIDIHSLENYIYDLKIFQLCHLNILQLHGFDITAKINQSFQS